MRYFLLCLLISAALSYAHPGGSGRLMRLDHLIEHGNASQALFIERALESVLQQDWHAAQADFERAQDFGESSPLFMALGRYHYARGENSRAVEFFKQVTVMEPQKADAHLLGARALVAAGNLGAAVGAYEHYFELKPNAHPGDYRSAAVLMASVGEHGLQAALKLLDRGMDRLGQNTQLQREAVDLELAAGRPQRALERWMLMGDAMRHSVAWQLGIARLEARLGDWKGASQRLDIVRQKLSGQRSTPARLAAQAEADNLLAYIMASH